MTSPGVSSDYAARREILSDFQIAVERVVADFVPPNWRPQVTIAEPPEAPGLGLVVLFGAFSGPHLHVENQRRIHRLIQAINMATDLVPSIPMEILWLRPPDNHWGFLLRVKDEEQTPYYPKLITVPNIDLRATNLLRRKLGLPERDDVL